LTGRPAAHWRYHNGTGTLASGLRPWASSLFPLPDRTARRRPKLIVAGTYLVALVLLSTVALLRQSGLPATRTIWAEDGSIFYADAVRLSFWKTLLRPYSGYGQLVPRLAAQLARLAPPVDAATVLALSGALGLAAVCGLVFHMARGHISSPLLRCLLVAATVLLPVASSELTDNIVNLPWWLLFAAFWALLWRPQSRAGLLAAALICFLTAASEPLVGLFLPLCVARAMALRTPQQQAPTAGLLLGFVYQGVVMLTANEATMRAKGFQGMGQSFALRVGLGWLTGVKGTDQLMAYHKDLAVALGALALVLVVLAGLWARPLRVRAFTVVAIAFSAICFVVPIWLREASQLLSISSDVVGARYEAVPMLLVISTVFVIAGSYASSLAKPARPAHAAQRLQDRAALRGNLVAAAICAALLVPTWVVDFRDTTLRSGGPSWPTEVTKATARCKTAPPASTTLVTIDPPGWSASLPCSLFQ
jgi:hypothetical protein